MAREAWTDERLDDLKGSVDTGFNETRQELGAARSEMRAEFQGVRGEMQAEFQAVREETGAMRRSLDQLAFGLIGARLAGSLTATVAIVTQL